MLVRAFAFLLPMLLVLAFDPQWVDFERARRALAMGLVGIGLLAIGVRRKRLEPPILALLAFALFALLSVAWSSDRWLALEHAAYLGALALLPLLFASTRSARVEHDEIGRDAITAERDALGFGSALTLALVALYGILQAQGWMWPLHYTVPHEPVSTLGNTNYAAEACAMLAMLALATVPARARLLAIAVLLLASTYLWTSGSRAGLVGLHLGAALWVVLGRSSTRLGKRQVTTLASALVIAATLGLLLKPSPASDTTAGRTTIEERNEAEPVASTLEVRLRIWPGALRQAKDALPLGVGAGNFRVDFPRYRDHEEIKLSSRGHQFGTRVSTAHNDLIQILVDFGLGGCLIVGFLLWSLFAGYKARRVDASAIAALAAFVPIAMFRAPLYNGAAAPFLILVCALAYRGKDDAAAGEPSAAAQLAARAGGLALAVVATMILVGESSGADFLRAKRNRDPLAGAAALDRAIAWDPFTSDWRLLRSAIHHQRGEPVSPKARLDETLADLSAVLERRPAEYRALVDVGFLGLFHPKVPVGERTLEAAGREAVTKLLGLDPAHPQGLFLASEYAFLAGKLDAGLAALKRLGKRAHGPIDKRIRSLSKMMQQPGLASERRLALAKLSLALRKLKRELPPQ